jgi:hypothetical protein
MSRLPYAARGGPFTVSVFACRRAWHEAIAVAMAIALFLFVAYA